MEALEHRVNLCKQVATFVLILIGILLYLRSPFGMNVFLAGVFTGMSLSSLCSGLARKYVGYGVANEINAIAGNAMVHDFGGLVWAGTAPKQLVVAWGKSILRIFMFLSMGFLFDFAFRTFLPQFAVPPVIPLAITLSVATLAGLLAEMYIWFVAGRYLYWYLPEKHARGILRRSAIAPATVNAIMETANERGLLLR